MLEWPVNHLRKRCFLEEEVNSKGSQTHFCLTSTYKDTGCFFSCRVLYYPVALGSTIAFGWLVMCSTQLHQFWGEFPQLQSSKKNCGNWGSCPWSVWKNEKGRLSWIIKRVVIYENHVGSTSVPSIDDVSMKYRWLTAGSRKDTQTKRWMFPVEVIPCICFAHIHIQITFRFTYILHYYIYNTYLSRHICIYSYLHSCK